MLQVCFARNIANNIPEFVNDRLILNYWTVWAETQVHSSVSNKHERQLCFSMQQPWGNYSVIVCASCFASVWMSVLSGKRKNQWRLHFRWNRTSWDWCLTSVPDDLGNEPYSHFSKLLHKHVRIQIISIFKIIFASLHCKKIIMWIHQPI